MVDILDMLDVVEAEVKTGELMKGFKAFDVGDEVVVEVQFYQSLAKPLWKFDVRYSVLP